MWECGGMASRPPIPSVDELIIEVDIAVSKTQFAVYRVNSTKRFPTENHWRSGVRVETKIRCMDASHTVYLYPE